MIMLLDFANKVRSKVLDDVGVMKIVFDSVDKFIT